MGTGDEDIPEAQLLTLPETALPQGGLSRLWALRANAVHERDFNELLKELTGVSPRHLMITAEDDPREKEKRTERHRREQRARDEQMREIRERQDALLAQIAEQQEAVDRRRKEIEDNALRLRDGRRVYIDGDRYRDGEGRVLTGADEAEAARQHQLQPGASMWSQKTQADRDADDLLRLREKIVKDREEGVAPDEAAARLTGYEKEITALSGQRQAGIAATPVRDYGTADYMAELGDDYTISTVPAFTQAAKNASRETLRKPGDGTETQTADLADNTKTPRPGDQGGFKFS